MKVAHFIDSGGLYGAEKMLLTLCKEQIKQGLEPLVVSCGAIDEPPKPLELACEAEHIPCLPWRMKPGLNLSGCKKLLKHLAPMGLDIFHSHGYKFNILLALNKSLYKARLGSTIHGYVKAKPLSKIWFYERIDRISLRQSDFIALVSDQQLSDLPPSVKRKANVIPNGFSFSAEKSKKKLDSILNFAAIGRLSKEKGFANLIESIAILRDRDIHAKLTIYGDGPLKEFLLQVISSSGLTHNIALAGYIENAAQRLREHSALIMPSATEGLPITLLEAIDLETPVIATKVGGIPSTLGKDYPFLIDTNNPTDIANAIEKLYCCKNTFLEELSKTIKGSAIKTLAANRMAEKYRMLYRQQ